MILNENSFLSLDDIRYVCKKFFGMLKIPIYFFDITDDILFEYSYEYSYNPLYENNLEILNEFLNINDSKQLLKLRSTKYFENYFSIKVATCDGFKGTILVGPTLSSEIDEKAIDSLIREFNILIKHRKSLINYYNHLVIMDFNSFADVSLLLYHSIYHHRLDSSDSWKDNQMFINVQFKTDTPFDISHTKKRRDVVFHHSQEYERELLDWIKEGNLEKLKEFTKSNTNIDGEKGIHSKNPLRNEKNIFISFASLVSHAAIEGGIDWELALSLSDFYIQTVEECNTIIAIYDLYGKMFLDYAERVHKIKINNYPKPIIRCQNFIFQHLYEKISLSQLADYCSMNPSYLSHLFKKEVGVSINEYIQKEKIEEAKKLIRSGEKTLTDIYIPLGFIDQSHFTKTFKKVTGINPKEYRLLYNSKKS